VTDVLYKLALCGLIVPVTMLWVVSLSLAPAPPRASSLAADLAEKRQLIDRHMQEWQQELQEIEKGGAPRTMIGQVVDEHPPDAWQREMRSKGVCVCARAHERE
jgi:hypothetical protein